MAEAKGFRAWTRDDTLKTGDKIYRINRHKGIMLAVIGEKSLAEGVRLTAAHLDAPRVDIRHRAALRGQRHGLFQDPLLRRH